MAQSLNSCGSAVVVDTGTHVQKEINAASKRANRPSSYEGIFQLQFVPTPISRTRDPELTQILYQKDFPHVEMQPLWRGIEYLVCITGHACAVCMDRMSLVGEIEAECSQDHLYCILSKNSSVVDERRRRISIERSS
jgi:hypothetical protein